MVRLEVLILETFILVLMRSDTKIHGKNLLSQKILMLNFKHQIIDVNVNKYGVKCGTSLRLLENKGWINKIDPYGWFQWYFRYLLGARSKDDKMQINRWKQIVSRFRGKLVKMIEDVGSKFDDYSISSKIRQIVLLWGFELTE